MPAIAETDNTRIRAALTAEIIKKLPIPHWAIIPDDHSDQMRLPGSEPGGVRHEIRDRVDAYAKALVNIALDTSEDQAHIEDLERTRRALGPEIMQLPFVNKLSEDILTQKDEAVYAREYDRATQLRIEHESMSKGIIPQHRHIKLNGISIEDPYLSRSEKELVDSLRKIARRESGESLMKL